MALDSTLISGLATAAATISAAWLMRVGRKRRKANEDTTPEDEGVVSLTKQLMADKNRDLDRSRKRITLLESQISVQAKEHDEERRRWHEERDQLRIELDYAHARIAKLGGPDGV